jgi:DNA-binding PadR family transcriptional regulator
VRTAVLALLAEEPMHGYQIIQEIGERSGGSWRPSPGSVYPTVSQLADEGLVRTEKAEGRSVIHLTDAGRQYVDEHREELDAVWNTAAAEDGFTSLREAGRGLAGAVAQVAQVGRDEQVAEAVRLLDETRRRLYLLLAGEETGTTPDAGPSGGDEADTAG